MSTFSRPVRDLFITTGYASETTVSTFIASASASEVVLLKKDGTGASAASSEAYLVSKDSTGRLRTSDTLQVGKVISVTKVDPVAIVPSNSSFVVDETGVDAGDIWEGLVRIPEFGSQSVYDEYLSPFSHTHTSVDTNDTVCQELIKSLSFNFSRVEGANSTYVNNIAGYDKVFTTEAAVIAGKATLTDTTLIWVMENGKPWIVADKTASTFATICTTEKTDWSTEIAAETAEYQRGNPWFDFVKLDGTTPTIYIIAKPQPTTDMKLEGYDIHQKVGLQILDGTTFDSNSSVTVSNVGNITSAGDGKNIRRLETFTKGHTGDFYRGMGYPSNFDATYDTVKTVNYYMVNVEYSTNAQDVNTLSGHGNNKILQVACADGTTATSTYNAFAALL